MCERVTVNLRTMRLGWRCQVKIETIPFWQSIFSYPLKGRPTQKICSNESSEEVKDK